MAELTPRMKELVQPYLAGIEPYDPNFTPTRINLSANENTYPVPAGVREAVDAALAATPLNRYPDPMSNDLRDELAAWHGVTRENICVGNGGDEMLYNYLLAFGGAGRTLLNCPPCFSEYAFFASLCQTEVRDVWRDPATFELDQAAVLAAAPECNLAIVTSPNNPTGDVAPLDFVAALCDACPGMVMVDEAYVELADDSFGAATTAQGLIAEHPNLVILHTLSKAFGAAGTRLGYVIAAPEVIDVFAAIRQIYSVNVLSQAAALACVRARDAYAPVVAQVASERERELCALRAMAAEGLPVEAWPSAANFVLVRTPHATRVRERLRDEYSILVRDFSYAPGLADCLRITVGTPQENDEVLAAFAALVKEEMQMGRYAEVTRKTGETDIVVKLDLDGTGTCDISTGVPFFDHMLNAFGRHGLFDLTVHAVGDVEVDAHHTVEDTGIVLGEAFCQALGDKAGITRFADAAIAMDETLVMAAVDISGRGQAYCELPVPTERVGSFDTELAVEFFYAFARDAKLTLHVRELVGGNSHHIIEAAFKAVGRTMRRACELDPRVQGIPSTKGSL